MYNISDYNSDSFPFMYSQVISELYTAMRGQIRKYQGQLHDNKILCLKEWEVNAV